MNLGWSFPEAVPRPPEDHNAWAKVTALAAAQPAEPRNEAAKVEFQIKGLNELSSDCELILHPVYFLQPCR